MSRPVYTQIQTRIHFKKNCSILISFPFHFILSETSLKLISTWLPEKKPNAHISQRQYKPHFELSENSVLWPHKAQYWNQPCNSKRSWDLIMRHQKPRTGQILDWKTRELQNMFRNIDFFSSSYFHMVFWKSRHTKYTQIIKVNRSDNILFISC